MLGTRAKERLGQARVERDKECMVIGRSISSTSLCPLFSCWSMLPGKVPCSVARERHGCVLERQWLIRGRLPQIHPKPGRTRPSSDLQSAP